MDGLLDPMPIFLTVEQVAQRWSKKFNVGADCNYVLDCYPELTFYDFTLAGKPIKYSREKAIQEHLEHLNENPQSLSVMIEQHSFQDKLPEYEKKNIKVRRDDLLLFEISFKTADLKKVRGLNDELEFLSDASLQDTLNELKQRNEAPYDGVLGTPPDSVTAEEKERFKSIRNRLFDGDCFTVADIIGLINDCEANPHSFSLIPDKLIPDKLKQDIRFLNSLWRAAEQNKPKAEVARDEVRAENENGNQRNERELKQGLREIWVKEGRPEMKAFFPDKLKKYINKSGSPITDVYTAGKDAGFAFKLSTGTTGNRTKKTLSNYVSEFKRTL
jgi:hypothetical protein